MLKQTQDPIKHQDRDLFAEIFNGFDTLNTFTKILASGDFQSLKCIWETFNDII